MVTVGYVGDLGESQSHYQRDIDLAKYNAPAKPEKGIGHYERITHRIRNDVHNGYSPPTVGTETESDAQARVLRNCQAGFTDERAPATGSGTMGCDELKAKAAEDAKAE